ncbi:MAG TPA: outer membrane beta-barrel family protein [Ignavibacteria bacterium]|nr:outer membrane beta-barrel family protein [Ignavibacteria bacterium]
MRITRIFSFLILLTFISTEAIPQFDPEKKGKGNFKTSFDDGEVSGYIFDRQSSTPIEGVSIQLIKSRDSSLYKGTQTDTKGFFKIQNVEQGKYSLSIDITGYNKVIRPVSLFKPEEKVITLDTIFLKTGTETDEIIVESEKPFMEIKGEKKIFNVDQSMSVTGGTAIEILKNIPSVAVDIDNNISLRGGQQIKFFINGRPVTGSVSRILEQMPAEQLSSVEVITNPSAKYDAEGSTGVINLVMKKYDDSGFNGQLNLNTGTGDKYGSGLNLNYKKDKYNLTGSYDFRMRNMDFTGSFDRNNFFVPDDALTVQNSDGTMRMSGNNARAEIEYNLSPSDVLSLNGRFNSGKRTRGSTENISIYDQSNILNNYSVTTSNNTDNSDEYTVGLNYSRYFKDRKQSLTGEASYSNEKDIDTENKTTQYIFPKNIQNLNSLINGSDLTQEINIQTDYSQPVSKETKIETGLKYNYRNTNADNFYYNQDNLSGAYILDSSLTEEFIFEENIGAAYVIYSDEGGDFTYNAGLRGEYWNYNIDQFIYNTTTSRNNFSLFPSATVSQKLGLTEEVSLSYSGRVRRPNYRELSPVTIVVSPVLYRQGNPDLGSEYIHSFELGFSKFFTSFSLIPSVFYKLTTDKITQYSQLIDSNITLNTSINANKSTSYGAELLINGGFSRNFSINGSISYFNQQINTDSLGDNSSNTFSGRLFAGYNLPWDAGVQLTYFYSGKMITAQGQIDPVNTFDISFRKDLFDKKLSVNLRISDIFNNMKMAGTTTTDTYSMDYSRQRESRVAMLTLSYKFGSESKNKKERKKKKSNDEPDNGMDSDY